MTTTDRTTEIYTDYCKRRATALGRGLTLDEADLIMQIAATEAQREERATREWDHTEVTAGTHRHDGRARIELRFYTAPDSGMVSVVNLTEPEADTLWSQLSEYRLRRQMREASARARALLEAEGRE